MNLYANESNPCALKLLLCAEFGKKHVELKLVKLQDGLVKEPRRLPVLELPSGKQFFSSNAAARYLFEPTVSCSDAVDEWLEWESSVLRPSIVQILIQSKQNSNLKAILNNLLRKLNDATSKFLTGTDIMVCDVAVWCTLYPLYATKSARDEFLISFKNLEKWMSAIEQLTQVKKTLVQYKIDGISSYQVLMSSERYSNQLNAEPSTQSSDSNQSSPTHQAVETATAEELKAAESAWLNGRKTSQKQKKTENPILPVAGQKNILITSALPYVNNVPHLGNIIGCVLSADVFARFCRLCNYNTLLVGGTDEYGTATETKALEEGLTPQQICDKYFEIHNTIYRWFGIGFDCFGRTTTPEQTTLVQDLFLQLNTNGFIQTESVEQLLCQKCNKYLADRFVEGVCPHPGCGYEDARGDQCDGCGKLINATELVKPRCKMCGNPPVVRNSQQFFLDLPKLEPLVYHWMEKSSVNWSNNARVIAKSWMKEGLKARCITRDLKWGIPVPLDGYRDKVFYVWFDAPIGYMSITKRYTRDWEKWWKPSKDTSVDLYQFMAKDNVPFHSVMFPAVLLGTNRGYTTVKHIMATEYLNYEDGKFSKSRGVGVFGTDVIETGIPCDVWRFYLLYVRPESQDSSFSWADFAMKNNSELLNNLGNFINRALMFTEKFFNSAVPAVHSTHMEYNLLALCTRELKGYIGALEKAKLRDGIRFILAISRHGNQYMQSTQPWLLVKGDDESKKRASTIIGICCNLVCLLVTLLHPYMPQTTRTILQQINCSFSDLVLLPENPQIVGVLPPGHKIGKPAPLFQKIENATIAELKKKYAGKQEAKKEPPATNAKISSTTANDVISEKTVDNQDAASLEEAINKQGILVRQLKSGGVPKSEWQPQVNILLQLKNKLSELTGVPIASVRTKTKK